jgi:hypothetical protein
MCMNILSQNPPTFSSFVDPTGLCKPRHVCKLLSFGSEYWSEFDPVLVFLTTFNELIFFIKGEGKAIPLQAWSGPEGFKRLRLQNFITIGTWRWQNCQPYTPAAVTPRKYSWYSFLLEAEFTPEPLCGRKDFVNEKFQRHHRESNPRHSDW